MTTTAIVRVQRQHVHYAEVYRCSSCGGRTYDLQPGPLFRVRHRPDCEMAGRRDHAAHRRAAGIVARSNGETFGQSDPFALVDVQTETE